LKSGRVFTRRAAGSIDCGAGSVAFEVHTPYGRRTTSLKLRPVYAASFSVAFAFDFTRTGSLGTARRPDGQMGIQRTDDVLGPAVVPALVLHPFGMSHDHASVFGALVNPLGFDVNAMTTSFFVGDAVCHYGLCLNVGAHLRKTDQLTPASGLHEGDIYDPAKGPLPTEKQWTASGGGTGVFVGASLDATTVLKLANPGSK
jgi:hypothetical protein